MKKALKIVTAIIIVLLALPLFVGLYPGADLSIPEGYSGQHITVSGLKIRYFQKGKGEDVLLIHGLPGSVEDWTPVFDRLSKKYRVTAIDRPGQGYSSADDIPGTLEHNAATALQLIKVLNLKNVTVVGHSYGGGTSLAMAVNNPQTVRSFVILGSVSQPLGPRQFLMKIMRLPVYGRGLARLVAPITGPPQMREGLKKAFDPNRELLTQERIDKSIAMWLQPRVLRTIAKEHVNMNSDIEILMPLYKNIRKPLFILHGAQDNLVPVEHSKKLHAVIPGSKLILLDNTGHQVQFARPEEVIKAIRDSRI